MTRMVMEEESCLETQIHLIQDFHCWCWCWRQNPDDCGVEDDEDEGDVMEEMMNYAMDTLDWRVFDANSCKD